MSKKVLISFAIAFFVPVILAKIIQVDWTLGVMFGVIGGMVFLSLSRSAMILQGWRLKNMIVLWGMPLRLWASYWIIFVMGIAFLVASFMTQGSPKFDISMPLLLLCISIIVGEIIALYLWYSYFREQTQLLSEYEIRLEGRLLGLSDHMIEEKVKKVREMGLLIEDYKHA
jgi:hypothetical protein